MTDIEPKEVFRQKAIALINEYRQQRMLAPIQFLEIRTPEISAFIRSIQLHEATKQESDDFKQKVSDAVRGVIKHLGAGHWAETRLNQFIIHKPDPLVDVLLEMDLSSDLEEGQHDAKWLRIKLDALGLEIREKGQ